MEIELIIVLTFVIFWLIALNCRALAWVDEVKEEIKELDKSLDETITDLQNDLSRVVVDKGNKYTELYGKYSFTPNGHRISIQQFVDIILGHLKIDIKKEEGLSIYKTKK